MTGPILAAQELSAGYGDLAAVKGVDIEVNPGEVVALIGPNGAGKTTTIMTLAGWLTPMGGNVLWEGKATRAPLHRRARMGLGLVTEQRSVFMGLTVMGNLRLGSGEPSRAFELFPELQPLANRRVGLLSGGEQQILSVARVLAASPRVILADELSLGLAPMVVRRLLRAIRRAADEGAGVLIVEQHAHQALAVADRAHVMRRGSIVLSGTALDVAAQMESVQSTYLSGPAEATAGETVQRSQR
jgi:branched-chain amino acid transport system ATP-binding protein